MGLKVLCAGCSESEREWAEALVRAALAGCRGAWTVSVVKIGDRWSVTLDDPERRLTGTHFVASGGTLRDSIAEAVGAKAREPGVTPEDEAGGLAALGAVAGPTEIRQPHQCPHCRRPFEIVYEAHPDEPCEVVAVACPHCWELDRVAVAVSASLNREYRADRVQAG